MTRLYLFSPQHGNENSNKILIEHPINCLSSDFNNGKANREESSNLNKIHRNFRYVQNIELEVLPKMR